MSSLENDNIIYAEINSVAKNTEENLWYELPEKVFPEKLRQKEGEKGSSNSSCKYSAILL